MGGDIMGAGRWGMSADGGDEAFDREVRGEIYGRFLAGRVPTSGEIARAMGVAVEEVLRSFRRWGDGHLRVLQSNGEILMAHPFSAVPTPFLVESGGVSYWGNCIWDGLGILAMLGRDGRVVTSCPDCGENMTFRVEGGRLVEGEGVVHFAVPASRWYDNVVYT
jgi:Alkylmercury lyase